MRTPKHGTERRLGITADFMNSKARVAYLMRVGDAIQRITSIEIVTEVGGRATEIAIGTVERSITTGKRSEIDPEKGTDQKIEKSANGTEKLLQIKGTPHTGADTAKRTGTVTVRALEKPTKEE